MSLTQPEALVEAAGLPPSSHLQRVLKRELASLQTFTSPYPGPRSASVAAGPFEFPAAAPLWSIVLGFGVSSAIGLVFGMWPALKAAKQDPIEALRYE